MITSRFLESVHECQQSSILYDPDNPLETFKKSHVESKMAVIFKEHFIICILELAKIFMVAPGIRVEKHRLLNSPTIPMELWTLDSCMLELADNKLRFSR